jgi:hypothetical protein
MSTTEQIDNYIQSLPEPKRQEVLTLHHRIEKLLPKTNRWFLDGKDEKGKVVTNPNIGYGLRTIQYANGKSKEVGGCWFLVTGFWLLVSGFWFLDAGF